MKKHVIAALMVGILVAAGAPRLDAAVKPHHLISDNAVLQQEMDLPIWGTADEGEKVTVKFQDQTESTVAKDGRWLVKLKPLKAGGPFTMTISGTNTVEIKNLAVGEVWVCSGQSNMEYKIAEATTGKEAQAAAKDPLLRICTVAHDYAVEPRHDLPIAWIEASSRTIQNYSAVAYFFGRDVRKALNVPVGLIDASVGATPAEYWSSHQTLQDEPALRPLLEEFDKSFKDFTAASAKYKQDEPTLLEKWNADSELAKKEGKPAPIKPSPPASPQGKSPTMLYNGMIAPLQPYAIRGVIWYQGEANTAHATLYQTLFPAMIKGWRSAWGQGEFPFLFVQIAPFRKMTPEIREAQLLSWQKTSNTAMVVTTDVGDANNIHPRNKEPVGARLALAARALAYGEKIEYSGPVYDSMKIEGESIVISFKHIGGGLQSREGDLKGFTIAGPDNKFVEASAKIDGEHVVVSNANVKEPKAVRFGWSNLPDGNLVNKENLPASPFRTDVPAQK